LFRVKVAQQLGGVLDICKKCSDRLALAVKDVTSTVCCRYLNLWQRLVRLRWLGGMSTSRRNQSGAAFSAEFFVPLDGCLPLLTDAEEGRAPTPRQFPPHPIFVAAFRTRHTPPLGASIPPGKLEALSSRRH